MIPKKLIILGGGASVVEGIENGLFNLLPQTFCCGLNYCFSYVKTTVNLGVDPDFYSKNQKELDALPLYIGQNVSGIRNPGPNTYWFNPTQKDPKTHKIAEYHRDLINGVYHSTLAGLFALSLFIKLIDEGEIYLLGYDYGPARNSKGQYLTDGRGRPITHWYQGEVEHRGIGKINWYTQTLKDPKNNAVRITNAENEFRVYANESKVKIYNVGLHSAIPTFEKISYEEFFTKKLITEHNQDDIVKALRPELDKLNIFIKHKGKISVPPTCNILNEKGPFDGSHG